MSSRPILSRPRTRIYDANYNIGENYYRPALDRLERKYYGRPLSPPRQSSLPRDLLDRHERAFADEDLSSARSRAEKHIREKHLFDSRGGRIMQDAFDVAEQEFDAETASALKRIRANKKVSMIDDVDVENTVNGITARRLIERSDKALKSVGLDESTRRAIRSGVSSSANNEDNISIKRRSLRVTTQDRDVGDLTKWSALEDDSRESAAAIRARQSRERINDIDDEMAAMAERQAARERRAARLKALVAESVEDTEAAQSALKAISYKSRREQVIMED